MPFSHFSPKVAKRTSGIEGTGLFAIDRIEKGEIVVVKGGHVMDRATRDRVAETLGPAEIQIADNLFIGPLAVEEREGSMMHLNHSCEPNVAVQGQIVFVAVRDIEAGEELAVDYGTMDDDDWEMDCRCGAAACRRVITGQDWRRPDIQQRYEGHFSDYLARKIPSSRTMR